MAFCVDQAGRSRLRGSSSAKLSGTVVLSHNIAGCTLTGRVMANNLRLAGRTIDIFAST